jgi:RsiW-degrading membrane proteinase PrsW (M82 family)
VTTLIGLLLALVVGFVPMIVYALLLGWFDRYEKEPFGLVAAAFVWGAVPAVIFSLIAELALGVPIALLTRPATSTWVTAVVVAPIAEEVFKGGALLLLFLVFSGEVDSPIDGILYGGLVGFGFAAVENTLYFGASFIEAGLDGFATLALFRAVLFGLNHALFTGLLGLGMAWGRSAAQGLVRLGAPLVGLLAAIGAHATHNASVTLGAELGWPCLFAFASDWGGVALLLVVLTWASVREQRWIERWLSGEVERGTLSREQVEVASSYLGRLAERVEALSSGDLERWWRLGRSYRLATELAFNKRRLSRFPEDEGAKRRVERLRRRIGEEARPENLIRGT